MKKLLLSLIIILPLITACSFEKSSIDITCFNVRYENAHDTSSISWTNRRDKIITKLNSEHHDVICLQEVLAPQYDFLCQKLTDYSPIGVGRDDGDRLGEFAPIFFDKNKYTNLESGTQWLSDTPEKPSIDWGAACIRIATWALIQENESGKTILIVNTHFDHVSEIARNNSAKQIIALGEKLLIQYPNSPIVIAGDFNAQTSDSSIKTITAQYKNSRPENSSQLGYTYAGFNQDDNDNVLIDFIFYKNATASNYIVDANQMSDHLAVSCTLEW